MKFNMQLVICIVISMLYVVLYKIIEQLHKLDHRLKHKINTDNCRLITFLTRNLRFHNKYYSFTNIYAASYSHSPA